MKEKLHNSLALRGHERIRTAVNGVADRCLTTRLRDPLFWDCKDKAYIFIKKPFLIFCNIFSPN